MPLQILKANKKNLRTASKILKQGGVVVYPTDTAYALGGVFHSKKAAQKILQIKGRTDTKFTLIASSLYQVEKFFHLNAIQKRLAKKYWPAALSLVVSKSFAVRVPNNAVARSLAKSARSPLIATSANVTSQTTPYSVEEVKRQYRGKKFVPDLILDSGRLAKIKTSTIVEVKKNKIRVLRQGSVDVSSAVKNYSRS